VSGGGSGWMGRWVFSGGKFFLLGGGGGGGGADSYFLLFAIYDSMHFLLHSMLCYHSIFPAISIFLLHQSLNQGWHTKAGGGASAHMTQS